ncbi:sugar ABC transporter permease [Deinococcus soli (ex Cha et al. 2016)]|uniref:Arabinogalactan oligomer/maltooligosaccharide transport system permease protein n=2 Tax=Deinococcus soli (ex Cha et al. 2016) TaxID=1309411 RepID=A0ACC6KD65_9DEIO|nr:sugar ABC transporter permease [Deinococcus soli (ex Cha et al. 2016)]MDR6217479.1 arabinogalactan oligomer/maltooligosaccharide transport system permease protein [Deinococcus soli (ex Cha et al. 2016)]MDR6326788.1 arabinogalactan oligomer/maltooligosaccharide transport system permease protein [Deinococcus soli (ex Cha et al. 2016)]MDR6750485.1 arabinogalactan oligomer/maltooligosaccharide transport system permease protein [Deinococcus soli (ex Cha et al. 2016)]
MTTAPNNLPPGGYVHREPSALRQALPWIIGVVVLAMLGWLGYALVDNLKDNQKSFSIFFVERGWVRFLLFLLAASGVLALTSLLGQRIGMARTGRRISYAAVLGDQLTHLFLILVVLIAIYPLFYVLIAAFDPRNSLFAFPDFGNPNIFYKTGLLPDLKQLNLENFAKLFEGVTIPAWQLLLAVIGGAALAATLISLIVSKVGRDTDALANVRAWGLRVLVAALAVLVIFMGPAQFTGGSNESKFLLSVRNTLLVSGLTGVLAILLSTTAGYAMARLRFPGRFQMLLFFIFIQMFPVFLALVAVFKLLTDLGLGNTFAGLILAYSGGAIAFNTWIFKGYVESLPESLEEAAMVDGATRWQTFTRVVLPLSRGMLVFIFLNQFIGTYAEFILASILMTGVEHWTVGVMLRSFTSGQFSTKWGVFAAAATLGALPIVALFYGFQNFFVGGAVAGGVKE